MFQGIRQKPLKGSSVFSRLKLCGYFLCILIIGIPVKRNCMGIGCLTKILAYCFQICDIRIKSAGYEIKKGMNLCVRKIKLSCLERSYDIKRIFF